MTNAISSVIIVGALLAAAAPLGGRPSRSSGSPRAPARSAVALASVNIFGGFLVTQRMLGMYRKKGPARK